MKLRAGSGRTIIVGAVLVVVVAAAMVLWRGRSQEVERLAFGPSLVVYRKAGDAVERLHDGDRAARGDLLQLEYIAAGRGFGVIASMDGDGRTTLHYPASPAASARLSSDGPQALGHAFELDGAEGFERFVFVTGDGPMDVGAVLESTASLAASADPARAPLEVGQGQEQWSIVLEKSAR